MMLIRIPEVSVCSSIKRCCRWRWVVGKRERTHLRSVCLDKDVLMSECKIDLLRLLSTQTARLREEGCLFIVFRTTLEGGNGMPCFTSRQGVVEGGGAARHAFVFGNCRRVYSRMILILSSALNNLRVCNRHIVGCLRYNSRPFSLRLYFAVSFRCWCRFRRLQV